MAKDKSRPFIVSADHVRVIAVGTAFSVQMGTSQVQVLVTEGRVAVDQPEHAVTLPTSQILLSSHQNAVAFVDAGNRLVVSRDFSVLPVTTTATSAEIAERLAWRAARVEFTDTPLSEAVRLMNLHGDVKLVVDGPELAAVKVTGLFRADNTESFVTLLKQTTEIHVHREGNVITLSPVASGDATAQGKSGSGPRRRNAPHSPSDSA